VNRLRAAGEVGMQLDCMGAKPPGQHVAARMPGVGHAGRAQAADGINRGDDYYFPKVADWRYEREPADPPSSARIG